MENNNKSAFKKLYSVLGIILIGALGSGLWDIFLKELVFNLGKIFVDTLSYFYKGYLDSLYENVGDTINSLEYFASLFLIIFFIFSPVFVFIFFSSVYRKFDQKKYDKDRYMPTLDDKIFLYLTKSKKRFFTFLVIFSLPITIMTTNLLIKEINCLSARAYIERTIEIIRPSILNNEYLELRSEFRQIDNKEKFDKVILRIKVFANNAKIELPEMKLYGIEK